MGPWIYFQQIINTTESISLHLFIYLFIYLLICTSIVHLLNARHYSNHLTFNNSILGGWDNRHPHLANEKTKTQNR